MKEYKVICVNSKGSTKLVKGCIYTVISLSIGTKANKVDRRIHLNEIGYYSIKYFTLLDGSTLENMPEFLPERNKILDTHDRNTGEIKTSYSGQYVKCRYGGSKNLKEGEIYLVEDQKITSRLGYKNQVFYDAKIKIKGLKNYVSPWEFEEISLSEQRKLKLKSLKGIKIKTGDETRKFLLYTEREKMAVFFDILSRSLSEVKSIKMTEQPSIIELMLRKGDKHNLKREDIEPYLTKIKPLLKSFNFK